MTDMQTFLIATFISVLCDSIYTFIQGSQERVALFQYLSPIVLGISLVSAYACMENEISVYINVARQVTVCI